MKIQPKVKLLVAVGVCLMLAIELISAYQEDDEAEDDYDFDFDKEDGEEDETDGKSKNTHTSMILNFSPPQSCATCPCNLCGSGTCSSDSPRGHMMLKRHHECAHCPCNCPQCQQCQQCPQCEQCKQCPEPVVTTTTTPAPVVCPLTTVSPDPGKLIQARQQCIEKAEIPVEELIMAEFFNGECAIHCLDDQLNHHNHPIRDGEACQKDPTGSCLAGRCRPARQSRRLRRSRFLYRSTIACPHDWDQIKIIPLESNIGHKEGQYLNIRQTSPEEKTQLAMKCEMPPVNGAADSSQVVFNGSFCLTLPVNDDTVIGFDFYPSKSSGKVSSNATIAVRDLLNNPPKQLDLKLNDQASQQGAWLKVDAEGKRCEETQSTTAKPTKKPNILTTMLPGPKTTKKPRRTTIRPTLEPEPEPEDVTTETPDEPTEKPDRKTTKRPNVLTTKKPRRTTPRPTLEPEPEPEDVTTETPDEPTSEPDLPTPEPDSPTSEPDSPTPEPDKPTPEPDEPTPEPDEPTPEPESPTTKKPKRTTPRPTSDPEPKPTWYPRPTRRPIPTWRPKTTKRQSRRPKTTRRNIYPEKSTKNPKSRVYDY